MSDTNVLEIEQWSDGVHEWQEGAVLDGGADSDEVLPIKQLANRTKWLRGLISAVCVAENIELNNLQVSQLLAALDKRYFRTANLGSQATDEEVSAAILAHLQSTDPHPQYLTELEVRNICQAVDTTLTAFASLTTAADTLPYATGVDTFSTTPLTAFARTLLDDANATTALATLSAVSRAELQNQSYISATTSGTAPTYVASLSLAPMLTTGLRARIKFHAATSAASTLNLNATGAKSVKQYDTTGTKIPAVIAANMLTDVEYDGVDWVLLNPIESSGALLAVRIITSNTTYTPTVGTKSIIVECVGGGGGGGGTYNTLASQFAVAGGGGAGGYGKSRYTSGFDSVVVTIGAGGAGGAANSATAGGNGGTTSFGALMSCSGGGGGGSCQSLPGPLYIPSAGSGAAVGANVQSFSPSAGAAGFDASNGWLSGSGASSLFGRGGDPVGVTNAGNAATGYGGGGGGASTQPSSTGQIGGAGTAGIVVVWEYAA